MSRLLIAVAALLISEAALASPFCDRAFLKEDKADKDTCIAELKSKIPPPDRASTEAWLAVMRLNIRAIAREVEQTRASRTQ